jgi:hypothetical protein
MKRLIILSFVLTAVLLQGCIVKSLHPFFKKENEVFRKELINTWTDQDGGRWEILPVKESKAYELRHYKDGDQPDQVFVAHLFKLDEQLYIDFFPISNDGGAEAMMFNMHLVLTHSIARVESLTEADVQIRWLNEEWLRALFSQNKIKISHEVVRDDFNLDDSNMSYVLTASTDELQKFIMKYGDEDKAFIDDNTVWLKLKR